MVNPYKYKIWDIYKVDKKIGNVQVRKGDCILHQIGAKNRDGSAGRILNKFFEFVGTDVYLTVRSDNILANKFYEKVGMEEVGFINWSGGKMPGKVWKWKHEN